MSQPDTREMLLQVHVDLVSARNDLASMMTHPGVPALHDIVHAAVIRADSLIDAFPHPMEI